MSLGNIIVPSLGLHSGLSALAYAASRTTRRLEGKDYLWPSGSVIDAWYHAVLRHVAHGVPLSTALNSLDWTQRLVLGGVTVWGGRLFYRIVKRSVQRGRDDPRCEDVKTSAAWTMALFTKFLPEAVAQTAIGLSWSIPLNGALAVRDIGAPREYAGVLHSLAVALFAVGLGMEGVADWQLERNKESGELQTTGVWSIVRHPNYLGDALVHFSIPLLLYADAHFNPLTLLGPLANYAFLRFVGGDKENEASQESRYKRGNPKKYEQLKGYQQEKNSFWPKWKEVGNVWFGVLVGGGVVVAGMERLVRSGFRG